MSQRLGLPSDAWVYLVSGLILTCSQGSCIVFVVPCWALDNVAVAMNACMDSILDIGNKFWLHRLQRSGASVLCTKLPRLVCIARVLAYVHQSCMYIMRYITIGILFMILLGMVFH